MTLCPETQAPHQWLLISDLIGDARIPNGLCERRYYECAACGAEMCGVVRPEIEVEDV